MSGHIEITLNGKRRTVPAGATVATLLLELELQKTGVAVERNCDIVPRASHAEVELQAGDQIEVVAFVGGG